MFKNNQFIVKGFTLIELVIVIVILGILAATVAPKYIDLKNDSKAAVLEGIAGAMQSGLQLVQSKAIIENQLGPASTSPSIDIAGTTVNLHNGSPLFEGADGFPEINRQFKAWVDIDIVDRNTMRDDPSRTVARFFSDKYSTDSFFFVFFAEDYDNKGSIQCYVKYVNNPKYDQPPVIEVASSDC